MSQRIVIVGGGYAGLFAARRLGGAPGVEVVLCDPQAAQQSLPMLADRVGLDLPPDWLRQPLEAAARQWRFTFRQEAVRDIDCQRRIVHLADETVAADGIIIASGAHPIPPPPDIDPTSLFTLDTVAAAGALRQAFIERPQGIWLVVGGGYTGVEVATNLWRLSRLAQVPGRILILERDEALCASLGAGFSRYIGEQVARLGIETRTGTSLVASGDGRARLSDGTELNDADVVWTVGVEGRPLAQGLAIPRTANHRLEVEPSLQAPGCPGVFVAGDAAAARGRDGRPLRPSVQAAVKEGDHAARNLLRHLTGRPLRPYRHLDLGYVVPMGHGRGCGRALGLPVYGRFPIFLHALTNTYRSFGEGRNLGLFRQLLRRSVK